MLISVLDWHSSRYFDVYVSFDGGANFTFHQRIETHREQHSQPHVSSIQTLISNLPQGQDVQVRVEATRGRLHFEGFALSHATLPEIPRKTLAVRNSDGAISGNYTFDGTLDLSTDSDVSATGGSGSLSIGPASGTNIGIDGNEIMARNGSAYSSLHLNANGGDVMIGSNPTGAPPDLVLSGNADIAGSAMVGWERVAVSGTTSSAATTCSYGGSAYTCYRGVATAACSAGRVVIGGGCDCKSIGPGTGYNRLCSSYPASDSTFHCATTSNSPNASFVAYAICARMGD